MSRTSSPSVWKIIFGALWYLVICGICLAGGAAAGVLHRSPLLWKGVQSVVTGPPKPERVFADNSVTFLVLGCDQDVYYKGLSVLRHAARSDMMMVARMNFDTKEITGVSIPRDTLCDLPGYRTRKINAYHAIAPYGQEKELSRKAVEHLIGVPIDKVIRLDYDAMQKLVDMVGGIEVDVPKQMDYDDNAGNLHVHLKKGRQRLNGYDAMCYVRYRHSNSGVADSDFQRQERQKDLLLAFKQAVFQSGFGSLPEVAEGAKAVLGGALTDEQILALGFFAKDVGAQRIRMGVIPTVGAGKYNLKVDQRRLASVLKEFKLTDERVSIR